MAHLWFDNNIVEADTSEDQYGSVFNKEASVWKTLVSSAAQKACLA